MKIEMSFYSLTFYLASIIYLYWGVYIIRLNPKERINRAFFALVLAVFIWSLSYGISNSAIDLETALLWRKIGSIGRMSFFSIILHFMLLLTNTNEELDKQWLIIPLYIPTLLLIYIFAFSKSFTPLQYNLIKFDHGWFNKLPNNIWNTLYYFYFVSYVLASLLVVLRWKRKIKSKAVTKQANLIFKTIALALILGGLFDFIPSVAFSKAIPQTTSIVILIPVWAMYHAARYYDLFHTKTFEMEEIVITDEEQKKIFINIAFIIFTIGILSMISKYLTTFKSGDANIYELTEPGIYISLVGLILGIIQSINKKSFRETMNIIVLLVSIPVISILFLEYAAITVWVIPIIIIMSSFLFSNRTLLTLTTVIGIGSQGLVWVMNPEAYVLVNKYDYIIRMIIILASFFIGSYINRIYMTKIKENDYQIKFQKMISNISFEFLSLNQDNFDEKVEELLEHIGSFFNVDRAYLFTINHKNNTMTYTNEWCNLEIKEEVGTIEEIPLKVFSWWIDQLERKKLVYIEDVNYMPNEAKAEQAQLLRQEVKSLVSVPIMGDGKIQAFIGIDSVKSNKQWTEENINLLNIMGNILSSGIIKINADKKIELMAYYDNLTKLPNRSLFKDRVNQAIKLSKRTETLISIIFIDLDNFKSVNDTIGHRGGDSLLRKVSKSLIETVRKSDTVARFGGDEFLIMMNDIKDHDAITKVADKVMDIFSEPFYISGQEFQVTASAGIAIYPVDGDSSENLIKNADIAMYQAKEKGKNQYMFCTKGMKLEVETSIELSNELYRALDRNELVIYYQPQINLLTNRIIGVEALVRWIHPIRGTISPGIFIPMAERNNLINDIGDWVLREACIQNKKWQDMGIPHINMAVNLSSIQITNPNIVEKVENIIKETGLDSKYIELEITESVAIKETRYVIDVLNRLKKIGVSIAIDDFGTEYSSLSRLKSLPIDRIKIDMQFVQGIESNEKNKIIAMVIINLAKSLGMNVLAEGVETKTQLDFLKEKMCDNVQGYYYYKPMPSYEIEKILIDLSRSEEAKDIFE